MLKINFYDDDIIKEYSETVTEKVKNKNGKKDDIQFIPANIAKRKDGKPYSISIKDLLIMRREEIFKVEGIRLYMLICSVQRYINKSNEELLPLLIKKYRKGEEVPHKPDNCEYDIITEAVNILKGEFEKLDKNYANNYFKKINDIQSLNSTLKNMYNELNKVDHIVDYSIIAHNNIRHKVITSLDVSTCPYCNRNYITSYGKENKKTTADLDHFYPKKQYPLFALSLFNFVPSCSVCNSRMKGSHYADDLMYPYDEGFGNDAGFKLKYIGENKKGKDILRFWLGLGKSEKNEADNSELVIEIEPYVSKEKKERIKNSIELFKLEEVYKAHLKEALEVALRTRIYCEGSYKKYCEKLFDSLNNKGMENTSVSDMESFIFKIPLDAEWLMFGINMNDEERFINKPLSKMTHDIFHSEKWNLV